MQPLPLLSRDSPPRPESILQFGTGRFLRGFADFFVDRAQRAGCYQGSIVVVQSTGRGRAEALRQQGGSYTLWTRDSSGESHTVLSAISRALSAQEDWDEVLDFARSKDLEMVFSNTTEVGLRLDKDDDIGASPPRSFPGKLTAVLYERARHFAFDPARGLVILPCELVKENGGLLRTFVQAMARQANLGPAFQEWLAESTVFCNTLVDRIVPGSPPEAEYQATEQQLGYRDALLITAEDYRLWAIEGDAALKERIGFAAADPGIVVANNIAPYRLRKIRLLNGGHTLTVPLGLLAGNRRVLDNMTHVDTAPFVEALLREEIGPTLEVDPATVGPYIDEVLLRWRNPHLVHRLIDITLQSTTKMRHRVVPTIKAYYERYGTVPRRIALGFAAYLLFMQGQRKDRGVIHTVWQNNRYPVRDNEAPHFRAMWAQQIELNELVTTVCSDVRLWGLDLSAFEGWTAAVTAFLELLAKDGAIATIGHIEGRAS